MSEFSDAFADTFDVSHDIFGDTCTIAEEDFDCIIHGFELLDTVRPGTAGRVQNAQGTVILTTVAWEAAKTALTNLGKKTSGAHVTIPGGTFRILNNPDVGYTSDHVELQLGPLS